MEFGETLGKYHILDVKSVGSMAVFDSSYYITSILIIVIPYITQRTLFMYTGPIQLIVAYNFNPYSARRES